MQGGAGGAGGAEGGGASANSRDFRVKWAGCSFREAQWVPRKVRAPPPLPALAGRRAPAGEWLQGLHLYSAVQAVAAHRAGTKPVCSCSTALVPNQCAHETPRVCAQVLVHVAYAKLTNFERQVSSHPPRAHTV